LAWVTWLTVHLWYLIGFENRLLVLIRWAFSFIAHGRGARLITGQPQQSVAADTVPLPATAEEASRLDAHQRAA
jgi:NADH:ubiquinone reductase (H+-translocating)